MHSETKDTLKTVLKACVTSLTNATAAFSEPHLTWRRNQSGHWQGEWIEKPSIHFASEKADAIVSKYADEFANCFFARYPEYAALVGAHFSSLNFASQRHAIVRFALDYLQKSCNGDVISDNLIDEVVNDFEKFVDYPTFRVRFKGHLLNYKSELDAISFPNGIRIRRLSDEEINKEYGGTKDHLMHTRSMRSGMQEFCLEGEMDVVKLVGDSRDENVKELQEVKSLLDQAILCLRTYKSGPIAFDDVVFESIGFSPVILMRYFYSDSHVPFGTYSISHEESQSLIKHAELVNKISDPAMIFACTRLADAESRTRLNDQIIDAVIGMESLLLGGIDKEDRKGELSFRFSLNYSMLFPKTERKSAYNTARSLYSVRSTIAHGSDIDTDKVKFAGETISLREVSTRAKRALRTLVLQFLSRPDAPYKQPEFWQNHYFGLEKTSNTNPTSGN